MLPNHIIDIVIKYCNFNYCTDIEIKNYVIN